MTKPRNAPPRLVEGGDRSREGAWAGELLGKLKNVEHDPAARQRVWRAIEAGRTASLRHIWWWLSAGAAASLLVTFGVVTRLSAPPATGDLAEVFSVSGQVQLTRAGGEPTLAQPGARLQAGSGVTTGAHSHALVRFLSPKIDAARVLLEQNTHAALARLNRGEVLDLGAGKLVAQVAPRDPGEPFVVRATEYRVSVLGTTFAVSSSSDDLLVAVHVGTVRVDGPGAGVPVYAGQCWSRRAGVVACVNPIEASLLDRLAGRETTAALSPAKEAPAVTPTPEPARRAKAKKDEAAGSDPVLALKARLTHAVPGDEREALLYELGVILTRLGRYREALDAFTEVAQGTSTHAELALYEVGRLNVRYLGDAARALLALERYRARYPSGLLRQEVDLTLVEALLQAAALERATEELDAFLRVYPSSERTADVLLLRGNVRRSRGQCDQALSDYDAVAKLTSQGAVADDARYFAAVCAAVTGNVASARQKLTEYLQTFANGLHRADAERALGGE